MKSLANPYISLPRSLAMITQNVTTCWLLRWIAQAATEQKTWEAPCVWEFVPLQIFLVMALHFSLKILVLFHAATRVEIKKMTVSPSLHHWNKIAEGYFVRRLTRQNKACYFSAHLLLTPKKGYHLSLSYDCVEGSKFFIIKSVIKVLSYPIPAQLGGPDGIICFRYSWQVQCCQN